MKEKILSVLLLIVAVCHAQDDSYYQSIQGLRQSELKTALWQLIQPSFVPSYGGKGEGYTWWAFTQTDVMADGAVCDRYSMKHYEFNGQNAVEGMNIEHSFANSWWGHTINNAYCDLHHLYPSDAEANMRKSNNPIGIVDDKIAYDNGVTRIGRSTSYRADSLITVWEPADEWKGDFARTYFYMATCYEDYADQWQTTEGLLMVERNRYPTLRRWVLDLLREWNREDPVCEIERKRNNSVQQIQGNRNPFIDHPELAEYIWGDSIEYRYYISKEETTELFVPRQGQTLAYTLQPLSRGYEGYFTVRGRGASGTISLNVDNATIELQKNTITVDELTDGIMIPFTCHPTEEGIQTGMLTINGGGIDATATLSIPFVDGLPAYEAIDVVCSVNSKKFTARWMNWEEGETYTLNVWTENDGQSLSGYPMQTTDTAVVVSNLKANTRYCYNVTTNGGIQSQTVVVDMPEVKPVFSAGTASLIFTSVPQRPSRAQMLTVTAIEVKRYETQVETTAPFEISSDGETWCETLTLKGSSCPLYVRLGGDTAEGDYEGELVLSTEGVDDIIVTLTANVDRDKAFFETFENGSKNAYAEGEVEATSTTWKMVNALIGSDANDRKNDSRAVRIRVQKDNANEVTMIEDFAEGCDSLWFWAGPYGKDTGVKLNVYVSIDSGETWTAIDEDITLTSAQWERYGYKLDINSPLRLKFVGSGSSGKRISLDDIQMSAIEGNIDKITTTIPSPNDIVNVYTTSGILIRTGRRNQVSRDLPQGLYIIEPISLSRTQ